MDGLEPNDENLNGIVGGIDTSFCFEKTFTLNATIEANVEFYEEVQTRQDTLFYEDAKVGSMMDRAKDEYNVIDKAIPFPVYEWLVI